jgi:hypothetical protein
MITQMLVLLVLIFGCSMLPSFLIFRSKLVSGWRKAKWVTFCIASYFGTTFIAGFLVRTWESLYPIHLTKIQMLELLPWIVFVLGVTSILMPWVVYKTFKVKHSLNTLT